ncbi:MAG: SEC-C metal-binding domain-containing protein [Gammaproteobacteria bacterium SHHR-1]|uniref:SEC-C metal-binding domain-containing protein n=1 Tax=Magnetovirga frankeli TaxID=947516 RepID=UPI001293504C|nr:SEC-C domain-containing protein [gamma proteobacterium SS-5]
MTISGKIRALLELGEKARPSTEIDYQAYGFSCADVPDLLDLVSQAGELTAQGDEDLAPAHALFVLARLGCPESIPPLLEHLDAYLDTWLFEDFMIEGLTLFGEPLIEHLLHLLWKEDPKQMIQRTIAVTTLAMLGRHQSDLYPRVVRQLTNYLDSSQASDPLFNSHVVASLAELGAVDALGVITRRFQEGAVNYEFCGDLEQVEIEMGVRQWRESPYPDFADELIDADDDLPWEELMEIRGYLEQFDSPQAINSLLELQGFLYAIRSAPCFFAPQAWIYMLWGAPGQYPTGMDKDDLRKLVELALFLYDWVEPGMDRIGIDEALYEGHLDQDPWGVPRVWCRGYKKGLEIWPELDPSNAEILRLHSQPMALFWAEQAPGPEQIPYEDAEQVLSSIDSAAEIIYQHFTGERLVAHMEQAITKPKVGRNDPCPCGSGKKYKKCCL